MLGANHLIYIYPNACMHAYVLTTQRRTATTVMMITAARMGTKMAHHGTDPDSPTEMIPDAGITRIWA